MVPLSTFATLRTTAEPRQLKKFQQLNAVRIQGVIPPGVSLDAALSFLEKEARPILPQGFTIDYAGESRQLRTEGGQVSRIFLLSAVLIYLVLAAQFESFRDPFIILVGSVPLAISGALMFSFLGFTTLNIYSQIGLITLVGLVSKNGILIVEFANHLQETGKDKVSAVIEAAATRLRPILMTTAATVVGHFLSCSRRARSRSAKQHRHHACDRHDHRHDVHSVCGAVDLHARRAEAPAPASAGEKIPMTPSLSTASSIRCGAEWDPIMTSKFIPILVIDESAGRVQNRPGISSACRSNAGNLPRRGKYRNR